MTRAWAVLLAAACPALAIPAASAQAVQGAVVLQDAFDGVDALKPWGGGGGVSLGPGRNGTKALQVVATAAGGGHASVRIPLPPDAIRGARVKVAAWVRAEGVAEPPKPYNGVKIMLHTVAPDGARWEQPNGVFGTFDWKPVGRTVVVREDVTEAWLVLGLEAAPGRAWFDDVRVTIERPRRVRPSQPPSGPVFKGHALPRLRGAMISTRCTEADLRDLAAWGANHVRWQLTWGGFPRSPADNGDLAAYDRWIAETLDHVDRLLPLCAELGILVLVDLHTPPGGRVAGEETCRIFQEKRFQDRFLSLWEEMARRFKGRPAVWGYDLVNEPVEGTVPEGLMDWQALAEASAKRVRAIDPKRAIVVEPAPWGGPEALENLDPIGVPGVVYSVHMYQPHKFTHQGVYNDPAGVAYPGVVDGKPWDKDQLRKALQPARDFARDYGVHLYIGEFSAIRWAPGESARDWLRDVIDIMEEYGWDWAYHAFREWDGWSVEHGSEPKDKTRAKAPNSRETLLRSWFAKNARAVW
jgi:aryl-phospho-beta-D-glucosidase BglC (GH1 family)